MSAPDTNVKKQERQHRGPLWGMWGGLAIVAVLLVWWLSSALDGEAPQEGQAAAPDEAAQEAGGSAATE